MEQYLGQHVHRAMPFLEVGRGGAAHERRQEVTDGPLGVERREARRRLRGEIGGDLGRFAETRGRHVGM